MTEEDVYIQEILVNNFRHIQPLNDRTVYRSFKLRDPVVKEHVDEESRSHSGTSAGHDDRHYRHGHARGDNSAGRSTATAALTLTVLLLTVMFH